MSISHDTCYPIHQVDVPPADIDTVPEVEGRKYILATWARSDTDSVGHIVSVGRHDDDPEGPYYVGSGGRFGGNHYRGVPLNAPVEAGRPIMLIDPPGADVRWAIGMTGAATRPVTARGNTRSLAAGILQADSTSSATGHMVGQSLHSNYWVPLSSIRQTERPERVFPVLDVQTWAFPVLGVQTWHDFPVEMLPQDQNGNRHILVTGAARRSEHHIGRVVQVVRDAHGWLVSNTGDYMRGAPLGVDVAYGDRILALDGDRSGKVGMVRSSGPHHIFFVPEGEGVIVRAERWVKMRDGSAKFEQYRPRETDTAEMAALRAQALELCSRTDSAVDSLVSEASRRGWDSHLSDVAQTAGVELPSVTHYARIGMTFVVDTQSRPTEEQQQAAQHNYNGRMLDDGTVGVIGRETVAIRLDAEADGNSPDGGITWQRAQGILHSRRGYSTMLANYSVTTGWGMR